jgi:hypothetical protein
MFLDAWIDDAGFRDKRLGNGYIPTSHGLMPFLEFEELLPCDLQDFLRLEILIY